MDYTPEMCNGTYLPPLNCKVDKLTFSANDDLQWPLQAHPNVTYKLQVQ
jgi:hypothetical protein